MPFLRPATAFARHIHPFRLLPSTARSSVRGKASAQSGGARTKEAKETGSSPTRGEVVGSSESRSKEVKSRAKTKILDINTPNKGSEEKRAEVEQHNKEFEQRYDRAPKAPEDKVDKKFWSGHRGIDN